MTLRYMPGFGNDFETEALAGALPSGPEHRRRRCAYGLYAEQLSGSPFTAPRGANERSWLYRMRPSVQHVGRFRRIDLPFWKTAPHIVDHGLPLGQLRWGPMPIPERAADLPHRPAHHDHRRRRLHAGRHGRACLSRHRADGSTNISTTPTAKC